MISSLEFCKHKLSVKWKEKDIFRSLGTEKKKKITSHVLSKEPLREPAPEGEEHVKPQPPSRDPTRESTEPGPRGVAGQWPRG